MSAPDRKCSDCNGYGRFMFNKACETCNATGTMTDAAYIAALAARVAKLEALLSRVRAAVRHRDSNTCDVPHALSREIDAALEGRS